MIVRRMVAFAFKVAPVYRRKEETALEWINSTGENDTSWLVGWLIL